MRGAVRGIQASPRRNLSRPAFVFSALGLIVFLVTSCATSGFRQSAAVNLELRFYAWDSVCITKPDTRENGFMPLLNATEIPQQIERLNPARDLAVVVVGYSYDDQQVREIGAQWYHRLTTSGFQRVVILRGSDALPTAGLPIVFDSAITLVNDTRGLRHPHAATPSAARADVAHPSIAAIQ
jgi:hypothetical protein